VETNHAPLTPGPYCASKAEDYDGDNNSTCELDGWKEIDSFDPKRQLVFVRNDGWNEAKISRRRDRGNIYVDVESPTPNFFRVAESSANDWPKTDPVSRLRMKCDTSALHGPQAPSNTYKTQILRSLYVGRHRRDDIDSADVAARASNASEHAANE
jgi:hypothetical protein